MEIEDVLDDTLTQFEYGLNVVGYVPVVSTLSGGIRMTYGNIEIVGAIASAAILAIKALFTSDSEEKSELFNNAGRVLVKYSLHGLANCLRSLFESVPFFSLITCLPYDLAGNRFSYLSNGFQLSSVSSSPFRR